MAHDVIVDGVRYAPMPAERAQAIQDESERMQAALDVRFDSNAGDDLSVREYFRDIAVQVWFRGEGFSGKRPFGDSDWRWEVYQALVGAGFIKGDLDEDDCIADVDGFDEGEARHYVAGLIRAMHDAAPTRPEKGGATTCPP